MALKEDGNARNDPVIGHLAILLKEQNCICMFLEVSIAGWG